MADYLPLLVFPHAETIPPASGKGFPPSKPHFPSHERQVERLQVQMADVQKEFSRYKASVGGALLGLEPEMVLVIEIVGSVDDFRRAVDQTEGLEWLGEWDMEDLEPDNDFYEIPNIGVDFFMIKTEGRITKGQSKEIRDVLLQQECIDDRGKLIVDVIPPLSLADHLKDLNGEINSAIYAARTKKKMPGRLFLSLMNEQGQSELLNLWESWDKERRLPKKKTKWRDVFNQTLRIRRWGIEETLHQTGMFDRWRALSDLIDPAEEIHCQIELFYRKDPAKRLENQEKIATLLVEVGGKTLGPFIDMPDIAFHAVKAAVPANSVRHLVSLLESPNTEIDIQLFKSPQIMYFRPTGQTLSISVDETGEAAEFPSESLEFPSESLELPPVVAIFDGAPNLLHDALRDRLFFDDPYDLGEKYQPGERRHGTQMASLVVHGEFVSEQDNSLSRKVYHVAMMQPNPQQRNQEHIPDEIFFEDRIESAVLRLLKGSDTMAALAPDIKIINLSIGDLGRPFLHTSSPLARLLDWLSWKYRVLFCVSAGNCVSDIDVGMPHTEFLALPEAQKITQVLKSISQQLSERRLLSPAESINALTIGALHTDESGDYQLGQRIDLLPHDALFSPISRFGHGFRRSIKPEINFPGGRQLYTAPYTSSEQHYSPATAASGPGQKVAWDSVQEGERSRTIYTRGTSNATALATRSGARIYDVLAKLQIEYGEQIPDNLIAVLIKTLLVHGAHHDAQAEKILTESLKTPENSRRFKEVLARYIGYGAVDIERVLACTEERATLLGCGEIRENQIHEYRFPLPLGLSGNQIWRRMVVTLAWFSPINSTHRNLREAKLELKPVGKWEETELELSRQEADSDQVSRGTVQHEILEGTNQVGLYQEDGHILLRVSCKKDATESLDVSIPYGLAVTLEVAEGVGIPIYQQIRAKIDTQVVVGATAARS